jgi:hypothetical protein
MNKFQKRRVIFTLRFFALIDVLFSDKFEVIAHKNGNKYTTRLDKKEILNLKNK